LFKKFVIYQYQQVQKDKKLGGVVEGLLIVSVAVTSWQHRLTTRPTIGYRDHLNILEWVEEALEHVQGKGGGKVLLRRAMYESLKNSSSSSKKKCRL
ncbi:hypothetical protein Tco_1115724, partial [Tanacetum coccineum]